MLDAAALDAALEGQDIMYANLAGEISKQTEVLVTDLKKAGVNRLIFILSLGIYQELPDRFNQWNQQMIGEILVDYRRAADIIEASDIHYTIVRPAWLTNNDETDYEITSRDEQFKGTEVSRKVVAAFVASVVADPAQYAHAYVASTSLEPTATSPSGTKTKKEKLS